MGWAKYYEDNLEEAYGRTETLQIYIQANKRAFLLLSNRKYAEECQLLFYTFCYLYNVTHFVYVFI